MHHTCIKQLGELCSIVVAEHAHTLLLCDGVLEIIKILAKYQSINSNVLKVIGQSNWIPHISFKNSTISGDGLCRINGICLLNYVIVLM